MVLGNTLNTFVSKLKKTIKYINKIKKNLKIDK